MEPQGVWDVFIEQGPLVLVLAVACYGMYKYIKGSLDASAKREEAREARYNALVDSTIANATAQTEIVVRVAERCIGVLERVERKLDEKPH